MHKVLKPDGSTRDEIMPTWTSRSCSLSNPCEIESGNLAIYGKYIEISLISNILLNMAEKWLKCKIQVLFYKLSQERPLCWHEANVERHQLWGIKMPFKFVFWYSGTTANHGALRIFSTWAADGNSVHKSLSVRRANPTSLCRNKCTVECFTEMSS